MSYQACQHEITYTSFWHTIACSNYKCNLNSNEKLMPGNMWSHAIHFKTKATLSSAHCIYVLLWEMADVLHRKCILDACVIDTGGNFHQNVCCLFQYTRSKIKMKAFYWISRKINTFHSAYKLKYSAWMFAFACVEFPFVVWLKCSSPGRLLLHYRA